MDEIFRFAASQEIEMAIRLVLAAIFGAVVGYEREHAEKPAGLRDLSLVSVGAAAFTVASIVAFGDGRGLSDPARVAAQIVTGIGFLGAGAILRTGDRVSGLTTAASIWVAAALGLLVGAGMYILSVVATVLALVILRFLPHGKA